MGLALSVQRSPYVDGGVRNDLVPLYLYENGHLYLHGYRVGFKFKRKNDGFDVFLTHRFEGFPSDRIPSSLTGMADRGPGMDAGVGYERRFRWGTLYGEALRKPMSDNPANDIRAVPCSIRDITD